MDKYITLKELRPQLPTVIDQADQEMARYIVTKHGHPVAVVMGFTDYMSLTETLIELSDPENVKDLQKAIKQVEKGQTVSWEAVKKKYNLA